jgi:hypothetical protein
MLTLTARQVQEIARLQSLAEETYRKYDRLVDRAGENPVQVAALSDSAATADSRGLIADCNGQLWRAVVVAVRYVTPEWEADDGPARAAIIVLADGSTYGAPYDLTGEITVTAPFDTALLDDDVPAPQAYDLEATLRDEIAAKLTATAAHVFQKAYRARPAVD